MGDGGDCDNNEEDDVIDNEGDTYVALVVVIRNVRGAHNLHNLWEEKGVH